MRRIGAVLLATVLVASVASAQKKPAAPPAAAGSAKPAAKPAEPTKPSEAPPAATSKPEPAAASSAAPPRAAAPRADAAPPATGSGDRLSPLTPRKDEMASTRPSTAPSEYERLLADIAALRSRVAAVTQGLFDSSLRVVLEVDGDDSRIASLVVTLDDGVLYRAPANLVAEDGVVVYEHAVAPGHHVLGIEVERYDKRGKQWRSWDASKLSIIVPESKKLEADILLQDDSGMAEDFPDDADGEYELGVRLRARVVE